MKKVVLTVVAGLSMFWLGGCMVIDCEDYGPPDVVCVVPPPPRPMVEIVHVPGPGPRPHHYHGRPHGWR